MLLKSRKPRIEINEVDINIILFKNHIKSLIDEILLFLKHKYSCTIY